MPESRPLTVVCLASYFKGNEFLQQLRLRGCRVVLVIKEKLRDEAWAHDSLDEILIVPNSATADRFIETVSDFARHHRVDRIVALEEYDVMHAAMIREHLRIPGMGTTTARLFRDKLAMRVKAFDAGIRVPDFVHVLNYDEIRMYMESVPGPWVLKPRADVSAVGIQKLHESELVWRAIDSLDARPLLTERSTHYLLEKFIPGEVFHVDSLVENSEVVFAGVNRYWRPPMDVAHKGGVFLTTTVERGTEDEQVLLEMNRALLGTLGFVRGATHAEFIKSTDGDFYFLEVAGRVGGAFISEALEAATGVNVWREWANLEIGRGEVPYALPDRRTEYAGVVLALARQEWPDLRAYTEPEIVLRPSKRHHAALIVSSPDYWRVQHLLGEYARRVEQDFLAVLPPMERPQ
ncbi:MAG: ATP-grasp domain-containing protein [Acidobacteria bacterium]|nr:ATP-grasp domain-containing protein [Acidobacteriota bacterium]